MRFKNWNKTIRLNQSRINYQQIKLILYTVNTNTLTATDFVSFRFCKIRSLVRIDRHDPHFALHSYIFCRNWIMIIWINEKICSLLDLAFIISQTYFNDISHFFVFFFKVRFLNIKYFCIDILVLDKTCTYFSVPTIIVFTIFNFPRTWLLPATNNKSRCCSQISFSIFHKLNRGSNSTVNWGRFGSVILIFF